MYQLKAQQVITNNDKNKIKNVAGSETSSEKKCNSRQTPNPYIITHSPSKI
jgi:hypothetical protein